MCVFCVGVCLDEMESTVDIKKECFLRVFDKVCVFACFSRK